ncbi:importin subunit beta-3, partial [Coemansia erecta]
MSGYEQTAALLKVVMSNLMSSDNAVRSQAETVLNSEWRDVQPQTLLGSLAFLVHRDGEPQARAFAAVLLRRIAFQDVRAGGDNKEDERSVWSVVPQAVHQAVKAELLGALKDESDRGTRHKLCDTISEITNNEGENEWPDLLPALYACAQDGSSALRESAYRVFSSCPYLLAGQSVDAVNTAFSGALQDSDAGVRLAALQAAVQYILAATDKQRPTLAPMMPQMLGVLEPLQRAGDEAGLTEALAALIEPAEEAPKLFRAVLGSLVAFATAIGKNDALEATTRQTAMELLVTL